MSIESNLFNFRKKTQHDLFIYKITPLNKLHHLLRNLVERTKKCPHLKFQTNASSLDVNL